MNKLKIFKRALIVILVFGFACSIYGDGFIVIPKPPRPHPHPWPRFNPFPLEVKYHKVNVKIEGQVATTYIDQVFYNPSRRRLEGYYLFPIPKNSFIKKFSIFVNGKELSAELLDSKKARRIYEDIVRKMKDPALLEYSGEGVFKVRIYPIEPYSEKRVEMSYTEILNKDNNTFEYLYPLNTEKFSAKPLKNVSINVEIKSDESIKNIYCPTHKVEIIRKNKHKAIVGYEEKDIKPEIDFKLYYDTNKKDLGFSLTSYKKRGEEGFFFLSLSPGFVTKIDRIIEKDITFVIDVSGSMAGKKLVQAKSALLFCIENLNKGDGFDIIKFSTEAEALFENLRPVNKINLRKARSFIENLRAIGGTNIDEALTLALNRGKRKSRPYIIIFLTDGKPTIGETNEDQLLKKIKWKNNSNARIFTFGIGNEINTHLLDKITEFTKAYRTYISTDEDIEIKVSNFYKKVQSPVLTNLKLNFSKNIRISKMYPKNLPDMFKGSSLTILGRYKNSGKTGVILEGKVGNKKREFEYYGNFKGSELNPSYNFIPSLWASRRIGFLLDSIRLHGKSKELVDEITQLARTYGIITPYTSYLIVEDEKLRVRRREIRSIDQTLGGTYGHDHNFERKNKEEFSSLNLKSGSPSIRISKEIQELNKASNYVQTKQGQSRLYYKDKKGEIQNVSQEIKNILGRAFYNIGKTWVDSKVQSQKKKQINRIKFASVEYFKLLRKEPISAKFLALGKNVRFVLNNSIYEIYE